MTKFQFQIEESIRKNRLDAFLCDRVTSVSKMFLRHQIKAGECKINGAVEMRGGYHLQKGDSVEIEIDAAAQTAMKPENIPLEIVFEDEEIIVVNKPGGMLVHPSAKQKSGTLLNALAHYLNAEYGIRNAELKTEEQRTNKSALRIPHSALVRPGLVHRLDRETSGLVLIAKTKRSLKFLAAHFQRRLVEKIYLALVEGDVSENEGTINAPIGRFEDEKRWGVKAEGKQAETHFRVLEKFSGATLLELTPVTGRTNQLRIHCARLGHPIIGDCLYGGKDFSRLCLHAAKLSFRHPNGTGKIEFEHKISFGWQATA